MVWFFCRSKGFTITVNWNAKIEQTKFKCFINWDHGRSRLDKPYLTYKPRRKNGNLSSRWSLNMMVCTSVHGSLNTKNLLWTTIKKNPTHLIRLKNNTIWLRQWWNEFHPRHHIGMLRKNLFFKSTRYMMEPSRIMIQNIHGTLIRSIITLIVLSPEAQNLTCVIRQSWSDMTITDRDVFVSQENCASIQLSALRSVSRDDSEKFPIPCTETIRKTYNFCLIFRSYSAAWN